MLNRAVILRPLINEKSMALIKNDFYTFAVDKSATKLEVQKLVSEKFKVDVLLVRMVNLPSKKKMQRTRKGFFMTSGSRKAVVKLKKGQKIAMFENFDQDGAKSEVKVTTAEGKQIAITKEKKSLLRGTKVKVERVADIEAEEIKTDPKRPTKVSQRETKKGGK